MSDLASYENDSPIHDETTSRRRFLLFAVTLSGLTAAPLPIGILGSSAAWANSSGDPADGEVSKALVKLARKLFPYDRLSDDVFADVMGSVMVATSADAGDLLDSLEAALDEAVDGHWASSGEQRQLRALEELQGTAMFAAVLLLVRFNLHNDPRLWAVIDYPGSSVEYGGYLERGFDDIDWLPDDG